MDAHTTPPHGSVFVAFVKVWLRIGVIVVARLPCVRMHTADANNKMAKSAKSGKALGASASVHLTFQIRGAVAVTQSQINQP